MCIGIWEKLSIITLQWFPENLGENTAWDFVLRKEHNGENSIWKCKVFLPQSELVRAPMKKIKVKNFKPYFHFLQVLHSNKLILWSNVDILLWILGVFKHMQIWRNIPTYRFENHPGFLGFSKACMLLQFLHYYGYFRNLNAYDLSFMPIFMYLSGFEHFTKLEWWWLYIFLRKFCCGKKYWVDVTGWYVFRGFQGYLNNILWKKPAQRFENNLGVFKILQVAPRFTPQCFFSRPKCIYTL